MTICLWQVYTIKYKPLPIVNMPLTLLSTCDCGTKYNGSQVGLPSPSSDPCGARSVSLQHGPSLELTRGPAAGGMTSLFSTVPRLS